MSNTVLITGVAIILLAAIIAVAISKIILKKSFVFTIISILIFPIVIVGIGCFIVGVLGLIHAVWAAPIAVFFVLVGFWFVSKKLKRPMNEMVDRVRSLSEGDVDVVLLKNIKKAEMKHLR